jgi:FimV-like protein
MVASSAHAPTTQFRATLTGGESRNTISAPTAQNADFGSLDFDLGPTKMNFGPTTQGPDTTMDGLQDAAFATTAPKLPAAEVPIEPAVAEQPVMATAVATAIGQIPDLDLNIPPPKPAAPAPAPAPTPAAAVRADEPEEALSRPTVIGLMKAPGVNTMMLSGLPEDAAARLTSNTEQATVPLIDFDLSAISIDAATKRGETEPGSALAQQMATKLDLARGYIDLGVKDGARELLDEVMRDGTRDQRAAARPHQADRELSGPRVGSDPRTFTCASHSASSTTAPPSRAGRPSRMDAESRTPSSASWQLSPGRHQRSAPGAPTPGCTRSTRSSTSTRMPSAAQCLGARSQQPAAALRRRALGAGSAGRFPRALQRRAPHLRLLDPERPGAISTGACAHRLGISSARRDRDARSRRAPGRPPRLHVVPVGRVPGGVAVRELRELSVDRRGRLIRVRASANAFLHHMVRNIVGTLVYVGLGRHDPEWAAEVLQARDRTRRADVLAGRALPGAGRVRSFVSLPAPSTTVPVWLDAYPDQDLRTDP